MCVFGKQPSPVPEVKPPAPVPAAPAPEPTPSAPVTNKADAARKNQEIDSNAKAKGTNSLLIPLNIPSAGNGLSIPV